MLNFVLLNDYLVLCAGKAAELLAARAVSTEHNVQALVVKRRVRMTRACRGNAVLAHSCANLNGHFARNGDKRA